MTAPATFPPVTADQRELAGLCALIEAETTISRNFDLPATERCDANDRILEQQNRARVIIEKMTGQMWSRIEGVML